MQKLKHQQMICKEHGVKNDKRNGRILWPTEKLWWQKNNNNNNDNKFIEKEFHTSAVRYLPLNISRICDKPDKKKKWQAEIHFYMFEENLRSFGRMEMYGVILFSSLMENWFVVSVVLMENIEATVQFRIITDMVHGIICDMQSRLILCQE